MVYLAGYGMQLAGENYFIPVDSSISRDTDIPIEGLRISDYVRQLASLPLKASIVVLDAARQQPFIEGGQPIASGLALVEPDAAHADRVQRRAGHGRAQRAGALWRLRAVARRDDPHRRIAAARGFQSRAAARQRSQQGRAGAVERRKIDAQFMFFDRAPDAPAQAPPDQAAAVRNRPIRDLGVQDAYAAALERDTHAGL